MSSSNRWLAPPVLSLLFLNRGTSCVAGRRFFQNTSSVPAAFRPDDQVGISSDRDGIGIRLDLGNHFHVIEIGEDKVFSAIEGVKTETRPEVHQPALRMTIGAAVALLLTKFQRGPDQLKSGSALPEFRAYGKALNFCKVGKKPNSEAAGGLVAHIGEQMCGGEIIAVKFLFIRAFLFGDIDRAAHRNDPAEVFESSGNGDANFAGCCPGSITVV